MSTGLDNRPSATTYEVERLVQMAWKGQIRVPHFQRGFRWGREDVVRLFDSINRGYPVGSLLLWVRRAGAQHLALGPLKIEADEMEEALWVVDGQQRVISLASALHPQVGQDPRFALAYNLRDDKFIPLKPGVTEPHIIPLPVLFDLPRLLQWFSEFPEAAEYQEQAYRLTTVLRQHPVPAYLVKEENPEVLRDIFDRMNSYGKRLSRAEIFTALHAGDESEDTPNLRFGAISAEIDQRRAFGRIDEDTVNAAILARRGPDVYREIRSEFSTHSRRGTIDFPGEDRETAFQAGEKALLLAVEFLQQDAEIPHFTLLPYRYLLVVLTRVFGHFPNPDATNRRLLRRWLWRAARLGPEVSRGSTTGAVRQLCGKVRPDSLTGSVQDLLKTVARDEPPLPDVRRFRTNEAAAKIVLCSWWALKPRDPSSAEPFDTGQLAEAIADQSTVADAVRYIFAPGTVPDSQRSWAANRLLVPTMTREEGKTIGEVLATPPLFADEDDEWEATLRSHLVMPGDLPLLRDGRISDFLERRQETLLLHLEDFLDQMCEWDFEDTPPINDLVIEDLADEGDDGTL
ncbi:DUF262 domain-containing protein [Streptomonospora wellingtoniae]|uniref:DUF262 domain-containing protein n=1 Tax=Streptomonospora wellingtoniae TaxID=3075544 RepID=A0ABU2KU53_9ACTN|nr:DUF262 domain-containing protein [Streptomonospora sp. DSM 45055]MDT0302653.1 DUF262 domain-containing protein [Streptomonospora sp. DSM 45055]